MKTLLRGHTSPETAYVVDDYPYGFRLRCRIRYWLEYVPKRGFRLWSQTTNPKRANAWNKPKASTFARFGGSMFLDDVGHVQWSALTEYVDGAEAEAWRAEYGDAVPEAGRETMTMWVRTKVAYDAARAAGQSMANAAATAALVIAAGPDAHLRDTCATFAYTRTPCEHCR